MKIKVKFVDDAGAVMNAVLDDDTKLLTTDIGKSGAYVRDLTKNTLQVSGDWNTLLQFDGEASRTVGHAMRYTRSDGGPSGVATITAIE